MSNPFFYSGRIENPDYFVGREAELRRIFSALETAHTGQLQHVSVIGPRGMGKSSLLYHVTQIYGQHLLIPRVYRFIYVDLDDAHCQTQAGFLDFILDQLKLSHPPRVTLESFQERIERTQQRENFWPVLCLDEFEHIIQRKAEFPDDFFNALHRLGATNQLAFLTASETPLGQLAQQGDLTSPFFNIFQILELGKFTDDEADTLVQRSQKSDQPFTPKESEQVLNLADCHPTKLQIAASELYNAKSSGTKVSRRAWQSAYQQQIEHIFGETPAHGPKILDSLGNTLRQIFGTSRKS